MLLFHTLTKWVWPPTISCAYGPGYAICPLVTGLAPIICILAKFAMLSQLNIPEMHKWVLWIAA